MTELVKPRDLGPRIVSFAELKAALTPLTFGYAWGEAAIRDLWLLGAPVPQADVDAPVRRVLLPTQFMKWFKDVQARQGFSISPQVAYEQLKR